MNHRPFAFLFLLLAPPLASGVDAEAILGLWNTSGNRGQVQIYKVDTEYRAKIISLTEPNYPHHDDKGMAGKARVDRENPDPKLRDRPVIGLEIMRGLKHTGKNTWDGGRVYDPESGKTYRCKLTLSTTNRIDLRGFIGFSLLGRTEVWTR